MNGLAHFQITLGLMTLQIAVAGQGGLIRISNWPAWWSSKTSYLNVTRLRIYAAIGLWQWSGIGTGGRTLSLSGYNLYHVTGNLFYFRPHLPFPSVWRRRQNRTPTSLMSNAVFWVVAPCISCVNRRFGGTYRLHLQGRKIRERGTSVSRWL
jgi:hypothetical protein